MGCQGGCRRRRRPLWCGERRRAPDGAAQLLAQLQQRSLHAAAHGERVSAAGSALAAHARGGGGTTKECSRTHGVARLPLRWLFAWFWCRRVCKLSKCTVCGGVFKCNSRPLDFWPKLLGLRHSDAQPHRSRMQASKQPQCAACRARHSHGSRAAARAAPGAASRTRCRSSSQQQVFHYSQVELDTQPGGWRQHTAAVAPLLLTAAGSKSQAALPGAACVPAAGIALFDITPHIRQQVAELGVQDGFVNVRAARPRHECCTNCRQQSLPAAVAAAADACAMHAHSAHV